MDKSPSDSTPLLPPDGNNRYRSTSRGEARTLLASDEVFLVRLPEGLVRLGPYTVKEWGVDMAEYLCDTQHPNRPYEPRNTRAQTLEDPSPRLPGAGLESQGINRVTPSRTLRSLIDVAISLVITTPQRLRTLTPKRIVQWGLAAFLWLLVAGMVVVSLELVALIARGGK